METYRSVGAALLAASAERLDRLRPGAAVDYFTAGGGQTLLGALHQNLSANQLVEQRQRPVLLRLDT